MGPSPATVVSEVSTIGLSREAPARVKASSIFIPRAMKRLAKSRKTRESFTTTPDRATIPIRLIMEMSKPMKMCPQTAPTTPNGMALMTTMG